MAHHKSAIKRISINERNRLRNQHYKSMMKTHISKVRSAGNKEEAEASLKKTSSILDKLVAKGIIHKNKAANQKARLAKYVNSLS
jgi:small subunit ribosomal protein S20